MKKILILALIALLGASSVSAQWYREKKERPDTTSPKDAPKAPERAPE